MKYKNYMYFFINTCDTLIKEYLEQSFPTAIVDEYGESMQMDGITYFCDQVNVENIYEVNKSIALYELYTENENNEEYFIRYSFHEYGSENHTYHYSSNNIKTIELFRDDAAFRVKEVNKENENGFISEVYPTIYKETTIIEEIKEFN